MERLTFETKINAPADQVYAKMIGADTFKQWTSAFNPTSNYEGSWEVGSKMLFIGVDENGRRGGMVGIIEENRPAEHVVIRYLGIVDGSKEITEGPVAEEWQGYEIYTYSSEGDQTKVFVELDTNEQMKDYFLEFYPKALEKLKEICEE